MSQFDALRLVDLIQTYGDARARARAAEIDYACCHTSHDRKAFEEADDRADDLLVEIRNVLGIGGV